MIRFQFKKTPPPRKPHNNPHPTILKIGIQLLFAPVIYLNAFNSSFGNAWFLWIVASTFWLIQTQNL